MGADCRGALAALTLFGRGAPGHAVAVFDHDRVIDGAGARGGKSWCEYQTYGRGFWVGWPPRLPVWWRDAPRSTICPAMPRWSPRSPTAVSFGKFRAMTTTCCWDFRSPAEVRGPRL